MQSNSLFYVNIGYPVFQVRSVKNLRDRHVSYMWVIMVIVDFILVITWVVFRDCHAELIYLYPLCSYID